MGRERGGPSSGASEGRALSGLPTGGAERRDRAAARPSQEHRDGLGQHRGDTATRRGRRQDPDRD